MFVITKSGVVFNSTHTISAKMDKTTVLRERHLLCWYALEGGYSYGAKIMGTTPGRALYWCRKILQQTHTGAHSGWRHGTFPPEEEKLLSFVILQTLEENSTGWVGIQTLNHF